MVELITVEDFGSYSDGDLSTQGTPWDKGSADDWNVESSGAATQGKLLRNDHTEDSFQFSTEVASDSGLPAYPNKSGLTRGWVRLSNGESVSMYFGGPDLSNTYEFEMDVSGQSGDHAVGIAEWDGGSRNYIGQVTGITLPTNPTVQYDIYWDDSSRSNDIEVEVYDNTDDSLITTVTGNTTVTYDTGIIGFYGEAGGTAWDTIKTESMSYSRTATSHTNSIYNVSTASSSLDRIVKTFSDVLNANANRSLSTVRSPTSWVDGVFSSTSGSISQSRIAETFTDTIETVSNITSQARVAESFSKAVSTVSTPGVTARTYTSSVFSTGSVRQVVADITARMGRSRHGTARHGFGRPVIVRQAISYIQSVSQDLDRDVLYHRFPTTWTGANADRSTRKLSLDRVVRAFINPVRSVSNRITTTTRDVTSTIGTITTESKLGEMVSETFTGNISNESDRNTVLSRFVDTFTDTISTGGERTPRLRRAVGTYTQPFTDKGAVIVRSITHTDTFQTLSQRFQKYNRDAINYITGISTNSESFFDALQLVKPFRAVVQGTKRLLNIGDTRHGASVEDTTKTVETEQGTKKVHVRKSSTSVNVTNEDQK